MAEVRFPEVRITATGAYGLLSGGKWAGLYVVWSHGRFYTLGEREFTLTGKRVAR